MQHVKCALIGLMTVMLEHVGIILLEMLIKIVNVF